MKSSKECQEEIRELVKNYLEFDKDRERLEKEKKDGMQSLKDEYKYKFQQIFDFKEEIKMKLEAAFNGLDEALEKEEEEKKNKEN